MNIYQITFSNNIYYGEFQSSKMIVVYATTPLIASQIFVDLAFDINERYQKDIQACVISIVQTIYYDDISIEWNEPHDKCISFQYSSDDIDNGLINEFIHDNCDNIKLVLEHYLSHLSHHIVIEPLRISNQLTFTKKAR
jgi:hypothetical protein